MKNFPSSLVAVLLLAFTDPQAKAVTVTLNALTDTSLFQPAPNNNLGSSTLAIGVTAAGLSSRGLLLFDIASAIPSGSVIESATLTLYATREARIGGPLMTIEIHRSRVSWQEGSGTGNQGSAAATGNATWNNRAHGQTSWGTAGGQSVTDYSANVSTTADVDLLGQVTFASTTQFVSDVQSWLDNSSSNFGMFLIAADESTTASARRFASTEDFSRGQSPVPVQVPQLAVTYSVVPEPSSSTLLLLAGVIWAAILIRHRTRFLA